MLALTLRRKAMLLVSICNLSCGGERGTLALDDGLQCANQVAFANRNDLQPAQGILLFGDASPNPKAVQAGRDIAVERDSTIRSISMLLYRDKDAAGSLVARLYPGNSQSIAADPIIATSAPVLFRDVPQSLDETLPFLTFKFYKPYPRLAAGQPYFVSLASPDDPRPTGLVGWAATPVNSFSGPPLFALPESSYFQSDDGAWAAYPNMDQLTLAIRLDRCRE